MVVAESKNIIMSLIIMKHKNLQKMTTRAKPMF